MGKKWLVAASILLGILISIPCFAGEGKGPIAINLIAPFYRDTIFETQNLKKVVLEVENNLDKKKLKNSVLEVEIRKAGALETLSKKSVLKPAPKVKVEFDCKELPYGKMYIAATLKDNNGKTLAETNHPLQKLPYKKGEVWLGKDLNWYVDGKPFFLLGEWGDLKPEYANTFLSDAILPAPVKTILCFYWSDQTPGMVAFDDYIKKFTREQVANSRDNPGLFAYFIADEPELLPYPQKSLEGLYQILREEDPYHPVVVSNFRVEGGRTYANAADFNVVHPYPFPSKEKRINDFSKIPVAVEDYLKYTDYKHQVGFMHQGFNCGDHNAVNSRIPTYVELRDQNILALICGAKSIFQYNIGSAHYPEIYIGVPYLTQELAYLGKAVLAPESKLNVKTSSAKVRTLLQNVDGELYLFVSNADMEPRKVKITIPGISSRSESLAVISEDRSVPTAGDSFTDTFDTFEVHVYTTSKEKNGLLNVKEICKKIDAANQARKKPGNLAFQVFEGDGVTLNVSSTQAGDYGHKDNGLWHVVDGTVDRIDDYKNLTWQDKTPDEFPDWIEINLPEKHTVSRVVVYPFEKSLKDYSVQAFVSGEWKEVDKVSGKNDEMIIHTFPPVTTDRIRLWITATNGPNSKITETEVYEK